MLQIDFLKLPFFGVTGTNGKTTTAFLLEGILEKAGRKPGLIGTVTNRCGDWVFPTPFTTPDPPLLEKILDGFVQRNAGSVVMEVSSHGLVQQRIRGCAFHSCIFTNLTQDHLDYHKTMEDYFAAKLLLFTDYPVKNRIIHASDPYGAKIIAELRSRKLPCRTYGEKNADLSYEKLQSDAKGIHGELRGVDVQSPLIGAFNKQNIAAAVLCMLDFGVESKAIAAALKEVRVPGRMERVPNTKKLNVVVDFAHTPDALEKALSTIQALLPKTGKLFLVFGCGGDRDAGKRPLMGRIAAALADRVWITSDNPRTEAPDKIIADIRAGIQNPKAKIQIEADRKKAIHAALSELHSPDDFLLIAGKGHETYQIVGTEKLPFDDRAVAREYLS